jgi:flavin reductase (DIM6/NTAB) family NADH-FMN oxidoreductase RutF
MTNVNIETTLEIVNQYLKKGQVFLTSQDAKPNTMIIGWGGINNFWSKPIFIAPVRQSRYSHSSIQKTKEFTISIPFDVDLGDAVKFCGSKSGRDYDKFSECNFTPVNAQLISTPIIGECTLHFECRVVYQQDIDLSALSPELANRWYGDGDYHTLYYGEIIACYSTK